MYGSLYNNPYSNSNPYAESTSNLLAGAIPGEEQPPKNGEDDLQSLNSVYCFFDAYYRIETDNQNDSTHDNQANQRSCHAARNNTSVYGKRCA